MEAYETYGQEELSTALKEVRLIKQVRYYESTDSTILQAKAESESGTLVVADSQTAGRGRRGKTWQSPKEKNIYFSLLLRPDISPDKASMLTLVMALAVAEGIRKELRQECAESGDDGSEICPRIKWPNDIVLNGKKICGILTEMTIRKNAIAHVVIGVGINVYRQPFPPELVDIATDLETECGQIISRSALLANILKVFESYYATFLAEQGLQSLCGEYNRLLVNRNREVCVLDPQGEYSGIATGITDTGELCVELADGSVTRVYAGEVSVRGIYGYV